MFIRLPSLTQGTSSPLPNTVYHLSESLRWLLLTERGGGSRESETSGAEIDAINVSQSSEHVVNERKQRNLRLLHINLGDNANSAHGNGSTPYCRPILFLYSKASPSSPLRYGYATYQAQRDACLAPSFMLPCHVSIYYYDTFSITNN